MRTYLGIAILLVPGCRETVLPSPLIVEPQNIDFGVVGYQSLATKVVVLRNNGTSPYDVLSVKTSCACTVSTQPHAPIPPNGECALEVGFQAKRYGAASTQLTIIGRYRQREEATTIQICAFTPGDLVVDPPRLLLTTNSPTRQFCLYHHIGHAKEPAQILSVTAPAVLQVRPIEKEIETSDAVSHTRRFVFSVDASFDGVCENTIAYIEIRASLGVEERVIRVPVEIDPSL